MKGLDKTYWAIILIAIIAIGTVIGVFAYVYMNQGEKVPAASANLHASLITTNGKALDKPTLNVSISNTGGDAKGVSVSLNSDAFSQLSTIQVDVPASQTVYAQCKVQIKDVNSQEYSVSIVCSCNGAENTSNSQFYVLPAIGIVNVRWYQVGFIVLSDKSTIGPNDNTTIYFKITSQSTSWTYTVQLSATATVPGNTQGLTITPSSIALGSPGPQGTSNEYSFGLRTHNTPNGKYVITIHVLAGSYEIASDNSKTLTVSS